jgi:hypothetical protein
MRLLYSILVTCAFCLALSGCVSPSYLTLSNATGREIVFTDSAANARRVSIPANEARDVYVLSSHNGQPLQFSISSGSGLWTYSVPLNDVLMAAAPFRESRSAGAS